MNALEVKNIKKYFKNVKAVDDLSFTVKIGEIFGFLGPNGAGKTTTIRCIMDLINLDDGKITLFNKDHKDSSESLKSMIGYLSAEGALYSNWTGNDHISFVQNIQGVGKDDNSYIEKFNVDLNKKVKTLSTGNRQKLSLILSLIGNPKLLILDEPTRGLDPLIQNLVHETLLSLKASGTTIFISSHDLSEVEKLCDRVAIIKEGCLVSVNMISEIKDKKLYLINIEFQQPFRETDFEIQNVSIIAKSKNSVSLKIVGDINPVLKVLNNYTLRNIQIEHASLEEVFLNFYKK